MARVTFIKNLDALNILRFWKIAETDKYVLLDVEYNAIKKYSKKEQQLAKEQWFTLYDEYFILRNNSESKRELEKMFEGSELKMKIFLLSEIQVLATKLKRAEHTLPFQVLNENKIKISQDIQEFIGKKYIVASLQPLELMVQDIQRIKTGLTNKYNMYYKSKKETVENQVKNVYQVCARMNVMLEGALPRPEQMSTSEFIEYERICIEKHEAAKAAENVNKQ